MIFTDDSNTTMHAGHWPHLQSKGTQNISTFLITLPVFIWKRYRKADHGAQIGIWWETGRERN